MQTRHIFTLALGLLVFVQPGAAQTKTGGTSATKTSSGTARPGQATAAPSTGATNTGNRTGTAKQREVIQPALKLSSLKLDDEPKSEVRNPLGDPVVNKILTVAWNVVLNGADPVPGNKVNAQRVELQIQKSSSGASTVSRTLSAAARDFTFGFPHQPGESVSVTVKVVADCTFSNGNTAPANIALTDSQAVRRDPPATGGGTKK